MSTTPSVRLTRRTQFPLVWLVPLIALAISLWLGISELASRGPNITIEFADGSSLEADKTVLEYKGVPVGLVKSIALKKDLSRAVVVVALKKNGAKLARAQSQFWVVRPQIGASGVSGLETLVSGAKLMVRPGPGAPAKWFRGLDSPPPPEAPDAGRSFILRSEQLGSLSSGSPVMYRQLKVGQVEASRLAPDSTAVLIRIHVGKQYADLIRTNTRFWNAGGFNIRISLLGAEVKDSSLESLISGGIAFATPDGGELAPPARDGAQFDLAAEAEKSWLKWAPKIPLKTQETSPKTPAESSLVPQVLQH